MSQEVEVILGDLGMSQYLPVFFDQGFDTWETILDITESDLYVARSAGSCLLVGVFKLTSPVSQGRSRRQTWASSRGYCRVNDVYFG